MGKSKTKGSPLPPGEGVSLAVMIKLVLTDPNKDTLS